MFKLDSKFVILLGRAVDYMVLNLMFILCSVPMITIGASRNALLYVIDKIRRDEDDHILRMFWKRFCQEFKKSTALWGIFLLIAVWMLVDLWALTRLNIGTAGFLLMAVMAVVLVLTAMIWICALGYQRFFEDSVRKILRNSLILTLGNFPTLFFLLLLDVLPIILSLAVPTALGGVVILWTMIGFSVTARIDLVLYLRMLKRYLPEEYGAPEAELTDEEKAAAAANERDLRDWEKLMGVGEKTGNI